MKVDLRNGCCFVCTAQVNGDSTFDCGRRSLTVSTVCQSRQLLTRKFSVAMGVSYVTACTDDDC